MNFWWCNQSSDWSLERPENVVCASDLMLRLNYRRTVGEVKAGDIIVHYKKPRIVAFSRAKEDGRHHEELPLVSGIDYGSGWRFATEYHDLASGPDRSLFINDLTKFAQKDYAVNPNGTVKQGYFLQFDKAGLEAILKHVKESLPSWMPGRTDVPPLSNQEEKETYQEGEECSYFANRYERDPKARAACIDYYKPICWVCRTDLGELYGAFMSGFIHVHHIVPLSQIGRAYEVHPLNDLRPVCPNCHAALHRKGAPTMEELSAHFRSK
jgi:hypothetical protein